MSDYVCPYSVFVCACVSLSPPSLPCSLPLQHNDRRKELDSRVAQTGALNRKQEGVASPLPLHHLFLHVNKVRGDIDYDYKYICWDDDFSRSEESIYCTSPVVLRGEVSNLNPVI